MHRRFGCSVTGIDLTAELLVLSETAKGPGPEVGYPLPWAAGRLDREAAAGLKLGA